MPTWLVGRRDAYTAHAFIHDLAGRLRNRVQLTTDGLRVYADAVESAFGSEIDYSMLVKLCAIVTNMNRVIAPVNALIAALCP